MKICKQCEAINADGAQFCCKCGAPLGASQHAGGQSGSYQPQQTSQQPTTYQSPASQQQQYYQQTQQQGYQQAPRNIGFGDAVRICLKEKYASFEGRATRSEYWYFVLFVMIVAIAATIGAAISGGDENVIIGIYGLFVIGFICPSVSVVVRRLHDTGRSGWWYWICLIPYIGGTVLLILMCLGSQERDNEYGPYIP